MTITSQDGAALDARIEAEERRKVALLSRKQDIGEQICILQIKKDADPGVVDSLRDERARIDQELYDFDKLLGTLKGEREVVRRGEFLANMDAALQRVQSNGVALREQNAKLERLRKEYDSEVKIAEKLRANGSGRYEAQRDLDSHRKQFPNITEGALSNVA